MPSFIRTIQQAEAPAYLAQILSRSDHFIPLKFEPKRSRTGDFLYLAYQGKIIARALISEIVPWDEDVSITSEQISFEPRALVRYRRWQKAPRAIAVRGWQGIRYLDKLPSLGDLDAEEWEDG